MEFRNTEAMIMVVFDEGERQLIENMKPNARKFCTYPQEISEAEVSEFMGIESPKEQV
jgi:hypothetical protein